MTTVLATVGYAESVVDPDPQVAGHLHRRLHMVPLALMMDRKLLGRFQNRYGPNRVGPFGALQPMADIFKLLNKEQFRPRTSVGFLFAIAPAISVLTACVSFAIVPFGNTVDIFGTQVGLYGIDPSHRRAVRVRLQRDLRLRPDARRLGLGLEVQLPRRDALRRAADLLRGLDGPLARRRDHHRRHAVADGDRRAQNGSGIWYFIPQFVGFVVFMVAAFAETSRPPFDLPEADAELVAGYNTEYGGGRFASYYAAEYFHMVIASGIAVTMFFGGWLLPFGIDPPTWVDPIVVLVKITLVIAVFVWVRATLPRLRYDQLMSLRLEGPAAAGHRATRS